MKNGLSIIHITQIKLWLAIISLSTYLDLHFTTYEKVLILGDFNVGTEEQHTRAFCGNYNLASLIKQPTFYKNPNNPTCTELILSNTPRSLLSTWVIETGLADFHVMTLIVIKKRFRKFQSRLIYYRFCKNANQAIRERLLEQFSRGICKQQSFVCRLQKFCDINLRMLNQHTL